MKILKNPLQKSGLRSMKIVQRVVLDIGPECCKTLKSNGRACV